PRPSGSPPSRISPCSFPIASVPNRTIPNHAPHTQKFRYALRTASDPSSPSVTPNRRRTTHDCHRAPFCSCSRLPVSPWDVALQRLRPHLRSVNIPPRIDRHSFRRARRPWMLRGIRNERAHASVLRAADANAALPIGARAVDRARLRVGDVDVVLRVDVDAARPAELVPGVEQLAVLVEDLDPVVAPVA